ncbi:MAG: cysteine synthase A [Candidatus Eremiobacteraeota bacterium]|nr:cysteine synthase A [Candidatus Eremiobacteraeota bacterium]
MRSAEDGAALRDVFAAVGNTPLILLPRLSAALGRTILGKAEFLSPGGSVKDRAAKFIIEDAERTGRLRPGGVLVEGTAGNTGIALALLGNARGYHCIIVTPDDQSQEKIDLLHAFGADVRIVPAVGFGDENNYYHVAERIAAATPNAIFCDQFNNTANFRGHYETTGPEIWNACGGRIQGFVAACGTGGTFAGVSRALKERNPRIKTVVADPFGSALFSYVKSGTLEAAGDSVSEGIGIRRITDNFRNAVFDDAEQIDDQTMVEMAHFLLREEGLFVGGSAALNVAAAARVAGSLPTGSTVVTVLCDGGGRYLSRLFNPAWLAANDLTPRHSDLTFLEKPQAQT